ncbi:helicase associated domain-containing protein [Streptomyces sp. NPDC060232]|uniref:helicase associated domain-containing protein n=1 Tax=Streptomyces sp. NPDC060232 TaxID=3347079 RepID=UPI00365EA82F
MDGRLERHYAYLAQLLADGARPAAIVPGVTRHGEDIGRWLASQRRNWDRLNAEQQRRLAELGGKKAPHARKAPAKTTTAGRATRRAAVHADAPATPAEEAPGLAPISASNGCPVPDTAAQRV